MLSLILVFFIGKSFHDLARVYNKSQWVYAILGVVSYYAGTLLLGMVIAIFIAIELLVPEDISGSAVTLMAIPAGILTSWGTYSFLKGQWRKKPKKLQEETLDGDLLK